MIQGGIWMRASLFSVMVFLVFWLSSCAFDVPIVTPTVTTQVLASLSRVTSIPTLTSTASFTPTLTPTASVTASPSPTASITPTSTPSASSTPTDTPRPTLTPMPTPVGPLKIPANPKNGFEWPYLLYVPSKVSGTHILVVPNNTGSRNNNFAAHETSARRTMFSRTSWAKKLAVPLLVPIFPRFDDDSDGTIASQYNGRGTLEGYWIERYPKLAREDRQMVAMIDDARGRLKKLGITVDKKVLIEGYSASAMFTSRFSVLHPDRVQAAAFGGHGWAIVPTDRWGDLPLPYPYGTGDIEMLTGHPFNLDEFRDVAIFVYMGERDDNGWALPWYIGPNYNRSEYYSNFKNVFGSSARELSDSANKIYESFGCSAEFVVYRNQNHQSAYAHESDILKFFQDHR
jgi:pimeloyl-ACP methyl ester carboxylesterase